MPRLGYTKPERRATVSPTVDELRWIAGFYEGEGCACRDKKGRCVVQIAQNDRTILDWLQLRLGGLVKPVGARGWSLQISGPRSRAFLMTIYTFLWPRRRSQALKVLGLCDVRLQLPDAA